MDRFPLVKMYLTAAATSLHAAACENQGRLPANLERMAHLVDDALHEADMSDGLDLRGTPPDDWTEAVGA